MSVKPLSSRTSLPPPPPPPPPPHPSFNDSASLSPVECLFTSPSSVIFSTYAVTKVVLLLPVCVFVLRHGLRRRTRSRPAPEPVSHCDYFTYHVVAMETVGLAGCVLCAGGILRRGAALYAGYDAMFFCWFGQTYVHVLTCVERYLAVAHPAAYRRHRRSGRAVRARNAAGVLVWPLSAAAFPLQPVLDIAYVTLGVLVAALAAVSFCSLAVLRVLMRPGPGEEGGGAAAAGRSKRRACYIILVILKVLVVKFGWTAVWTALAVSGGDCVLMTAECWFNLPGSLLLPLLFLLRKSRRKSPGKSPGTSPG